MEALGIDTKLLLAQGINFVLFMFIFKRFISKPFFNFLNEAQKKEKEKDRIMADLSKSEQKALETEKAMLKEAKAEATAIVADAKKTAVAQTQEMLKKAQADATEIKQKAENILDEERAELYAEVKKHVVETSGQIAKSALGEYLTEDRQRELTAILMHKAQKHHEN